MKDWQKIVLVIISIIILILILLIINNLNPNVKNKVNNEESNKVVILGSTIQNINLSYKDIKNINSYEFEILNYESNKVNSKDILYNITIDKSENISLSLYKNSNKQDLIDGNVTDDYLFKKDVKTKDKYELKINSKNLEKSDNINIIIKAWSKE